MRAAAAGIDILPRWRPRDTQVIQEADDGSKWADPCDYRLCDAAFERLDRWAYDCMGGSSNGWVTTNGDDRKSAWFEVDRFASTANHKLRRFNSILYATDGNGGDALVCSWGGRNNYAFPPYCLIGSVLAKLRADRACGVVVAPLDTRRPWWPLVTRRHSNPHVVATTTLWKKDGLIASGDTPVKEGGMPSFLAVLVDFRRR